MQSKSPVLFCANPKLYALLICLLVTLCGCSKQSEPAQPVPVIAPAAER